MKKRQPIGRRLALAAAVASWGLAHAAERPEVLQFDFGGPKSPVAKGFYRVLPDTAYSPQLGYGFLAKRVRPRPANKPFDQNRRVLRNTLVLDDATRDGIYNPPSFRVDVPDGLYRVVVLTGHFSRPGCNRPDAHHHPYTIKAGSVLLFNQVGTAEDFYRAGGRYFHSYYRDWRPDVNLYREIIAPWMPMAEAEVRADHGQIVVTTTRFAPISALWVFPANAAAGRNAVEEFKRRQEAEFNSQYPYLPSQPEHAIPELPLSVQQAAAVMYVRDDALALRPGTRPVPRDLGRPLRLFASQGESEAGVVAVTPLRHVKGPIQLTASDLVGKGQGRIPASALDIRYIRYNEYPVTGGYEVRPFFLVPWRPKRWEKGITRGFWVDLRVPGDAAPGFYEGKLQLSAEGVDAALPVQVRVLPLKLPRARLRAGTYAGSLESTTFRAFFFRKELPTDLWRQALRTRMEFLADQGFTGLFDSLPWYPVNFEDGKIVPTPTWEMWKVYFDTAKSIPSFSDRVFNYYCGGPQLFPKCPHWLRRGAIRKMKIDEIRFSDEAVEEMTTMAKWLYRELRAAGYPELTFYVQDELGNDGAKGARYGRELLKAMNRVRKQVPGGFRTCISTLSVAIAREYLHEADIVIPNSAYPVTPETIAELRGHGCTLGLYNMGATRFSYGFYPWRVNALLRAQWSFSYDGDVSDPFVALPFGSRVSCDCHFTPEWQVLPSIGMLVQREGVDDFRYIQLLEERVAAAKKDGRANTRAAQQATQALKDLHDAVKETYRDPENNWDKSTMDYWRWRVADAAMGM